MSVLGDAPFYSELNSIMTQVVGSGLNRQSSYSLAIGLKGAEASTFQPQIAK